MAVESAADSGALREDAKRIDALLDGLMARVNREIDGVIKQYQKDSMAAMGKRKKGEYKAVLVPRAKRNRVRMPRIYWEVMTPRSKYARENGAPRRKHISRNKHGEPYSERKLKAYTDDHDHEIVMAAQREFERLEAFAASVAKAIRAIKEQTDGEE